MKIKKLILAVMIFVLSLGVVAFATACNEVKTIDYTITVTCRDSAVLDGIEVNLQPSSGSSYDKTLTDGKAVFSVPADNYRVTLTGVPEEYTYESKTVTSKQTDTTIEIVPDEHDGEVITYTVTVQYPDGLPVVGCNVSLVPENSEEEPRQYVTDDNGVISADLLAGTYRIHTEDSLIGYTFDNNKYTVNALNNSVIVRFDEVFDAPPTAELQDFRGTWTDANKTIELMITGSTVILNSADYRGTMRNQTTLVIDVDGDEYELTKHPYAANVLVLKYSGKSVVLLPKNNYPSVELPAYFNGSWKNSDENEYDFYIKGSVFQLIKGSKNLMGSIIGFDNDTKILALISDETDPQNPEYGIYELFYNKTTRIINIKRARGEYVRTGTGTQNDPLIISSLVAEYSFKLVKSKVEGNEMFGQVVEVYNSVYLTYFPVADESYVVWNPMTNCNRSPSLMIGTPNGYDEEGQPTYNALLNWSTNVDNAYRRIDLKANTEYILIVTAYPDFSSPADRNGLPNCTVYFTISNAEGFEPPKPLDIPSKLIRSWYPVDDKNLGNIAIQQSKVLWNEELAKIESLNEDGSITASFDNKSWTFKATGDLTLEVSDGEVTYNYTAVPNEPVMVSYMFGNIFRADDGRFLYFDLAYDNPDNFIRKIWLQGEENEITVIGNDNRGNSGFSINVYMNGKFCSFDCDGNDVTLVGQGEPILFRKLESINSFNTSQRGKWQDDKNNILRIGSNYFSYNNITYKVFTMKNENDEYDFYIGLEKGDLPEEGVLRFSFDNENNTVTVTNVMDGTSKVLNKS